MLVPFERVRTATAPSNVIRLSCVRLPLMFRPPVVRPKSLPPSVLPLLIPAFVSARKSGLRPFNCSSSICFNSTSFPTVELSDCTLASDAVTETVSLTSPTASATSTVLLIFGSSFFPVTWNFLNPVSSAVTV